MLTVIASPNRPYFPTLTEHYVTLRSGDTSYVTVLTSAFYQIPLARESMKYCGVATPFKGVRVYARSAMGMPGSETALEEVMCRVLGHLLQEGVVAKIADDLYSDSNTPQQSFENWKKVLHALYKCDLRLSASKTVINPKSTTILGWIWSAGALTASPHRVNILDFCPKPDTVGRMRSFIGACKVLSHVILRCSAYLASLMKQQRGVNRKNLSLGLMSYVAHFT